ncbi:MAG: carboxymuconolactone decarboxylase family protein [Bacillaceae bacterium]|nr:carboxymuconolactone decarboxylase family protein [Bacillaceae bacterium]
MSDKDSLYKKSTFNRLGELNQYVPNSFKAFLNFDQQALGSGELTTKQKELIAVAIAHITGCPYCIDLHVSNSKKEEVTLEELSESIMVATALKAGSALAHGVNALNSYTDETEVLYKQQYFGRIMEFSKLTGDSFAAFIDFDQKALKDGALSSKEKEIIAVACAHTTGCPYCIDLHTKAAKKAGASLNELAEAVMVATALKAGSALAHAVNLLEAYDA